MPGLMVHLITAKKVRPDADLDFYIASIAPDAVQGWHKKDKTHYRDLHDRTEAIMKLAKNTDKSNSFEEGMLLHLFLDWKWDISVRDEYIKNTGGDWYLTYRDEIRRVSANLYHNTPWAHELWKLMDEYDLTKCGNIPGATTQELKELISENRVWHDENNVGPSLLYPPEFIEEFTDRVAREFISFRSP
mgnify:CR=1 FL=1